MYPLHDLRQLKFVGNIVHLLDDPKGYDELGQLLLCFFGRSLQLNVAHFEEHKGPYIITHIIYFCEGLNTASDMILTPSEKIWSFQSLLHFLVLILSRWH